MRPYDSRAHVHTRTHTHTHKGAGMVVRGGSAHNTLSGHAEAYLQRLASLPYSPSPGPNDPSERASTDHAICAAIVDNNMIMDQQLVSPQLDHRVARVSKRDALEPLSAALDSLQGKASKQAPHVMSEARDLTVMHVPPYLSSAAVARLLSKNIMAAGLRVFDALSCEEALDEDELQEGLVEALVNDEVLYALADHATSLRELSFRLSSAVTASSITGLLHAAGKNLRALSLQGIASVHSSNTAFVADPAQPPPSSRQEGASNGRKQSGGEMLLAQIPWQRLEALQILRLPQAPLTDGILISINKALKGLHEIDLSFCIRITDASLHYVLQKQERLEAVKLNGCDNVGDSALLTLCARTWRLFNKKRDTHAVPLHFFDNFMSQTYKQSNAVVVQVLKRGANTASSKQEARAGGSGNPPARAVSLWQGLDPNGRNSVSFEDVKRALKSFPMELVEFLFFELRKSENKEGKESAGEARGGGSACEEEALSFETFCTHFWELLEPLDEHVEFSRVLIRMRQKLEAETQPNAVRFMLQQNHDSLVFLGCEASELHAVQETTEKETQHAHTLRILAMQKSARDMMLSKAEVHGPLLQRLQRLHLLLPEVLGCAAGSEEDGGYSGGQRREEPITQFVEPALKAKIEQEGCWATARGDKGPRSRSKSRKGSAGVGGGGGETRQAMAGAVKRHMCSLKAQLRRYQSHVGPLLKLKDLRATQVCAYIAAAGLCELAYL